MPARVFLFILLIFWSTVSAGADEETPTPELDPQEQVNEPVEKPEGQDYDINFVFEDDYGQMSFHGADRAYTCGWRLSFIKAINDIPPLLQPVFSWLLRPHSLYNVGFAAGQQIYTPADIEASDLITTDQPYAGYLHVGTSFQIRNEEILHSFEIDLGIIGPASGAEQIQTNWHRIFGFNPINGWRNQLKTEPTLTLFYQQKRTLFSIERVADLTANAEGAFGNLYIYGGVGAQLRLGYSLGDDFGPTIPTPVGVDRFVEAADNVSPFEIYAFVSVDGRWMGRDLFLDGNTFQSGPHVEKENFVYDFDYGAAIRFGAVTLLWRQISRSREFTFETGPHHFASVLLNYAHRF